MAKTVWETADDEQRLLAALERFINGANLNEQHRSVIQAAFLESMEEHLDSLAPLEGRASEEVDAYLHEALHNLIPSTTV
jgi:hypothetical protein